MKKSYLYLTLFLVLTTNSVNIFSMIHIEDSDTLIKINGKEKTILTWLMGGFSLMVNSPTFKRDDSGNVSITGSGNEPEDLLN